MSDRELLEKAALNAGVALHWINGLPKEITEHWSGNPEEGPQEREWDWNPLTDDGDALRLAVKRGVFGHPDFIRELGRARFALQDQDDTAAYRLAITRVAALGDAE